VITICVLVPAILSVLYAARNARSSLTLLLIISVYQLVIPRSHLDITSLCTLLAWGVVLFRPDKLARALRDSPFQVAVVFLLLQFISLTWSPDVRLGLSVIGGELPFYAGYILARSLPVERIIPSLVAGLYASATASILVIYFALDHAASLGFYRSGLAKLIVGPAGPALFTPSGFNNVLLHGRSGGVFVNSNVASLFCGVTAVIALTLFAKSRSRPLLGIALLNYLAVILTGSKTGLFLAILSIVLLMALPRLATKARHHIVIPLIISLLAVASGYFIVVYTTIGAKGSHSLASRQIIWSAARHILGSSPIAGLGYGGWTTAFAPYASAAGFAQVYPPQNLLLYTFSESGLLASVALLAFVVLALRDNYRTLRRESAIACGSFISLTWVVLHGLGDNTTLFGDAHLAAFIGAVLALAATYRRSKRAADVAVPLDGPVLRAGAG
jgi:O-antigen ligase